MTLSNIKVIAFDADDTLWENETFFREAEQKVCNLLANYLPEEEVNKYLFEVEMRNLPLYGYGIKPFTLSLIEAAIEISNKQLPIQLIEDIMAIGKQMLTESVTLLPGIEATLSKLAQTHKLVVATKGDLLDQERKLIKSGLEKYFHHIEIVSDKTPLHYKKLVSHLDINPSEFLMVGNSMKSDILPVLEMGGYGFHIPFHTTWEHEKVNEPVTHEKLKVLQHSSEIISLLS